MLTDLKINRLKVESKTKRYADRDGFTLEVRASGNKVFIFRFQWDKKPQTITFGRYPSLSLLDARNIAIEYRTKINSGLDPREALKNDSKPQITLKFVAEQWYQRNANNWRQTTLIKHKRSLIRDIYPILGIKLINDISKSNILSAIRPHEDQGFQCMPKLRLMLIRKQT